MKATIVAGARRAGKSYLVERYQHAPPQERHLGPEAWIGYQIKISRMQSIDFEGRHRYRSTAYRRRELLFTVAGMWLMSPLVAILGLGLIVALALVFAAYVWNALVIAVLVWGKGDVTREIIACIFGADWPGPKDAGGGHGH